MCQGVVPSSPVRVNQNSVMVQEVPILQGSLSHNAELDVTRQGAQGEQNVPPYQSEEEGLVLSTTEGAVGGQLMPPPQGPSLQQSGVPSQLERRKSVKDLVTDFSSCLSSVSSGEDTLKDLGEQVTRRKKKKRKASNSPTLDK